MYKVRVAGTIQYAHTPGEIAAAAQRKLATRMIPRMTELVLMLAEDGAPAARLLAEPSGEPPDPQTERKAQLITELRGLLDRHRAVKRRS